MDSIKINIQVVSPYEARCPFTAFLNRASSDRYGPCCPFRLTAYEVLSSLYQAQPLSGGSTVWWYTFRVLYVSGESSVWWYCVSRVVVNKSCTSRARVSISGEGYYPTLCEPLARLITTQCFGYFSTCISESHTHGSGFLTTFDTSDEPSFFEARKRSAHRCTPDVFE